MHTSHRKVQLTGKDASWTKCLETITLTNNTNINYPTKRIFPFNCIFSFSMCNVHNPVIDVLCFIAQIQLINAPNIVFGEK